MVKVVITQGKNEGESDAKIEIYEDDKLVKTLKAKVAGVRYADQDGQTHVKIEEVNS